jgi:hypothetical protein
VKAHPLNSLQYASLLNSGAANPLAFLAHRFVKSGGTHFTVPVVRLVPFLAFAVRCIQMQAIQYMDEGDF